MKNKLLKVSTATVVAGCLLAYPVLSLAEGVNPTAQNKTTNTVKQTNKAVVKKQQEPLKVGKYSVSVIALKEHVDELSMAGQYTGKKALLEVVEEVKDEKNKGKNIKNKKKEEIKKKMYLSVDLTRSDWMQNKKVMVNGKKVEHIEKILKKYEEKNEVGKNKTDHTIRFEIPTVDAKIKLGMDVIPMGNASVAYRIDLQDDITEIVPEKLNTQAKVNKDSTQKSK